MNLLVTGGAGYIGSHVVRLLREAEHRVLIVDDFSTGFHHRVQAPLLELDLAARNSPTVLADAMRRNEITGVIHFAGLKDVDESLRLPERYQRVNIGGLINLVEAMRQSNVRDIVFSSSAAVYGHTSAAQVSEPTPCAPANPYGASKLAGERILAEAGLLYGIRSTSLRYFNVAGSGWRDLADQGRSNLIPIVINRILDGRRPVVFGDKHSTADGSCVRDYIHVLDLARAHLAALDVLAQGKFMPQSVNLGTGGGASVLEVIAAVQRILGTKFEPDIVGPRQGDPAFVVANPDRASRMLGWAPVHGLDEIVESAIAGVKSGWRGHGKWHD